jgi:hypothetical protein
MVNMGVQGICDCGEAVMETDLMVSETNRILAQEHSMMIMNPLAASTTRCFSSSSVRNPGLWGDEECGSPLSVFMWSTAILRMESLSSLRGTAAQVGIICASSFM